MADDRPLDDVSAALAELRARQDDQFSTLLARAARLPTGTTLLTPATTPPPGTLLLQGQTVQRADYPGLVDWVQAAAAGGFVVGASTLQLPDWRGRVPRGVAAGESVGQLVGADSRALTIAQLPAHDHNVSIDNAGQHGHSGTTSTDGGHLGHSPFAQVLVPGGDFYGVSVWNAGGANLGAHNHGFGTTQNGDHNHNVDEDTVGGGAAVDLRQASFAVNYLIWT